MTHGRAEIGRLLEQHGLAPRRSRGQNFVADANTVRRIARLAGTGPGDRVVEVGPGLGSLTLALAETGAEIVAIEVDNGLVAALREVLDGVPNVEVVHADAMEYDWSQLQARSGDWHLVANLPYNIATPLVADVLDHTPWVTHLLVMVQREVADRLVAAPRTPAYGAVSVKIAYWAEARIVGVVPASVFVPRPNVESALVEIRRRPAPVATANPAAMFALVRAGFGQRRKMLRRSLAGLVAPEAFAMAGIDPQQRAEELGVAEWVRLAEASQ